MYTLSRNKNEYFKKTTAKQGEVWKAKNIVVTLSHNWGGGLHTTRHLDTVPEKKKHLNVSLPRLEHFDLGNSNNNGLRRYSAFLEVPESVPFTPCALKPYRFRTK